MVAIVYNFSIYLKDWNIMIIFWKCILIKQLPINVCDNSSHDINNKIDTKLFVHRPYLRTNYVESNTEEDIDLNEKSIRKSNFTRSC